MQVARAYKRRPGAKFVRKTEESEVQRFIRWFKGEFPGVIIYTDFAAGLPLTDNERIRMMAQRSEDGMPDVYIDHPMTHIIDGKEVHFHGARFEFKKTGTAIYLKDGMTLRKDKYKRIYKPSRKHPEGYIKTGDHLQEQHDTLVKYNKLGYYGRFIIGMQEGQRHARWFMKVPEQLSLDPDF